MTVFWDIAPCSLVEVDRLRTDGGKQYAPLKRRSTSTRIHDAISQRTAVSQPVPHGLTSAVPQIPSWETVVAQLAKKFVSFSWNVT
jgi:hypothetical protein